MTGKKFALIESSIIVALVAIFAVNIVIHQKKNNDNETHISMDYYGNSLFEGDDNYQDNVWLRMIKEQLGFTPVIDTAVSTTDYETKINIAIGANNISDMFSINLNQFNSLVTNDQIYDDLTNVFDNYASDELKEAMGWEAELKQNSPAFKKWTINKKLKAIPTSSIDYAACPVLYIRKDWLDIIGYDAPKTLDELERILFKFKENNLGKGLSACKDILFSNAGSLDLIFNAYGSYPTLFKRNSDGSLAFGFEGEETKRALDRMQYWYSNGLIYPQFAQTNSETIGNKIASSELGIIYGDMSIPLWRCNTCVSKYLESDFICVPAPALNANTPTKVGVKNTGSEAYVVKKNYKHPERLIQMMNLYYHSMFSNEGDFERFNKFCQAYPIWMEPVDKNYFRSKEVKAAIDNDRNSEVFKDESIDFKDVNKEIISGLKYNDICDEAKYYYRNIREYFLYGQQHNAGNNWAYTRIFYSYEDENGLTMVNGNKGFDSSFSAIDKYADNSLVVHSIYEGVDTPSYSANRRMIETKIEETMIKIIQGSASSNMDKVVNQISKWTTPVLEEIERELQND